MLSNYKVTAIVSVYNGERFLRGCLENLVAQSIFSQSEVIIIDACSPQQEGAIASEFTKVYPNISYERTNEREGLYASWNRALRKAQGAYITNANVDDRHAPKALEILVATLDTHPEVALAYGNCRMTAQENSTFCSAPVSGRMLWPEYDPVRLLYGCCVGPQPMWRRTMHDICGYFDESYTIAGDYDMWLRMAQHAPFKHIPKMLGLYLRHEHNLENSNATLLTQEDTRAYTKALEHFLFTKPCSNTFMSAAIQQHQEALQKLLQNTAQDKKALFDHIYFHIYAQALWLTKLGKTQSALGLMQTFQDVLQAAPRLTHLLEYLLKHKKMHLHFTSFEDA